MAYVIVIATALIVAALTLFSGFGLGTILMPVFAIFFPAEVAVAATAVVHFANNLFKIVLIGRWADYAVVAKFAVPAAGTAILGALLLSSISDIEPIYEYRIGGRLCTVTAVKITIGLLISTFTVLEFVPRFQKLSFSDKYIPAGGALSGFFGGLSGHQGALRTTFLIRAGLEKKVFLGTVVVSAVLVDLSRLVVYGVTIFGKDFSVYHEESLGTLVVAATVAAFVGSFVGSRLVEKVTMQMLHKIVGTLLLLLAIALGAGLV